MPAGIDSMMFYGATPWHGLGTKLEKPATAKEAIRAAGLDWEVQKVPLYAKHERGETLIWDRLAIMRSDRMQGSDAVILGIVGKQYEPIQNRDAFRFFDPIVGKGAAVYHTAGSLGNGERIWILAKLPGEIRVVGDDITEKYLLLSNSHDGTGAALVKFTPVRVVCQNTLSVALKGGSLAKIAHMRGVNEKIETVHQALGIINDGFEEIADKFKHLAAVTVTVERLREYICSVLPMPASENEKECRRVKRWQNDVESLFETGRGNDATKVRGTLWAAYNGFTEFADYRMTQGSRSESGRLDRIWFGDAHRMKVKAFERALEFANDWKN